MRKILPPPGFDPRTAQPVASRYPDPETSLYPLNMKMGGPQSRSRRRAEETNLLSRRKSNLDSSVVEPLGRLP